MLVRIFIEYDKKINLRGIVNQYHWRWDLGLLVGYGILRQNKGNQKTKRKANSKSNKSKHKRKRKVISKMKQIDANG